MFLQYYPDSQFWVRCLMNESQICLFLLSSQHCNLVKYINLLTSYAFKHLENQMSLMKVKEAKSIVRCPCWLSTVWSRVWYKNYHGVSCECASWISMKLPCRHIFRNFLIMKDFVTRGGLCLIISLVVKYSTAALMPLKA